MKICMIAGREFFYPFDVRVYKEAKALLNEGHNVCIITPDKETKYTRMDDIEIHSISKSKRFGVTSMRLLHAALKTKADVYHCHELEPLIIGVVLKLLTHKTIIYDAHEHYPSLVAERMKYPKFTLFAVELMERFGCFFVDRVITVSPPLKRRFERFKKLVTLIYNCPDTNLFTPKNIDPNLCYEYQNKRVVLYSGAMGRNRGMEQLLKAIPIVRNKIKNVYFLFIGGWVESDVAWMNGYLSKHNLPNCLGIIDWVKPEKMPHYINLSEVCVVLYQPTSYNHIIGLPTKMFEYLACGKPVVASDFPEIKKIVEGYGCGVLVNPVNPKEIANGIIHLLEKPSIKMSENGLRAVREKYNLEKVAETLINLYDNLET